MSYNDKISIVIPFYNRIHLLEKTIQSVLQQDSSNWELILVDDGSTEEVDGLRAKYSSEKVRFFKRSRSPKGAPTCRNIGAENTSFDHIMFLDSDDVLAPWCITERTKVLRSSPNDKLYVFEALEFDASNPFKHRLRTIRSSKDPLKHFLDFQSVWQTSCMVWKKEAFKDN
jgi:glycosyltransferase involved in cell wall biosynthesis